MKYVTINKEIIIQSLMNYCDFEILIKFWKYTVLNRHFIALLLRYMFFSVCLNWHMTKLHKAYITIINLVNCTLKTSNYLTLLNSF